MSLKPQIDEVELLLDDPDEMAQEEDMPESQPQIDVSDHLRDVLKQQYQGQNCFVTGNLAVFPPTRDYPFRYLAPDVMVVKGVTISEAEKARLNSWMMRKPNRPAPTVVFEISSEETWPQDLDPKPDHYRRLGVREYFVYDPQQYWPNTTQHLRGWRYVNGQTEEIEPDERGWLWSEELESWLVPDGLLLQLYDREGNQRLTRAEAEAQNAEAERARAEVTQALFEAAQAKAEAALQREQALLEKLRKAGIDPDNL